MNTSAFETLATQMAGPVITPDGVEYDETRKIWNGMIDRRPAAIARCIGTSDVVTAFRFTQDNNMPFSIRGGGHNIGGLSLIDDGLLIDMSLMRGVHVNADKRIAHAQAGCTLGDVDRETQLRGLVAPLGFVSMTGIAGLTLGGGFGYLTRRFGWTSDNVLSMNLVTAEGKLIRASESENPDLFWGLRGGGGNFGIVTSIDYKLYPVGPEIMGGAVAWRGDDAAEVMAMYREVLADAPDEMTVVAALRKAPPAPWIDPSAHGKPIVALFVCHSGSPEDAERDVARIKSFGNPIGDVLQKRPYNTQQTMLDATQPKGRRYYWKSEFLPEISNGIVDKAIEGLSSMASPHSAILLFPFGDAIARADNSHSSVGNRDARAVINIAGAWDSPDEDASHMTWVRGVHDSVREFSTGGTYINFLTEDEKDGRTHDAYRDNYTRLADLKRKWDPDNVFCTNRNIEPAA